VVELDDRVWNNARFRRANPDYQLGKPFVYVGMTGLDPDIRFDKHKAGIQANSFVQQFGLHLLPELYERYNPLTYEDARLMEVDWASPCARRATACGRRELPHPSRVGDPIFVRGPVQVGQRVVGHEHVPLGRERELCHR
jgi:hypothetical protein